MGCAKKWRKENPVRYAWHTLKNNAKHRGKYFDLSYEDFKEFCYEVEIVTKKGKRIKGFEVDCIINELGYTKGNLQKLSKKENQMKGTKTLIYDYVTKKAYYLNSKQVLRQNNEIDLPF